MSEAEPRSATATGFRGFLPWWVWLVVVIEIAVPTIFGIATWIEPGGFIAGAEGVTYTILMYVTRNLTTALGLALAVWFRSYVALFLLILVRMATDAADMINATYHGEDVVDVIPFLFVVLIGAPFLAQLWLWKRVR